jgi:hypothetical protein
MRRAIFYFLKLKIFVFLISVAFAKSVTAAEYKLQLEPSISHIIIKPGSKLTKTFKLINTGDPAIILLKLKEVKVKNSKGEINTLPLSKEVMANINIAPLDPLFPFEKPFLIKSNEAIAFDVEIEASSETPPQDIYIAMIAQTQTADSFTDRNKVIIDSAVGSMIYITPTADLDLSNKFEISLFEPKDILSFNFFNNKYYFIYSINDTFLNAVVANKQINLISVDGKVDIYNKLSNMGQSFPVQKQIVLAQSQRELLEKSTIQIPKNTFGFFDVEIKLTSDNNLSEAKDFKIIAISPLSLSLSLFLSLVPALIFFLTKKIFIKR